MIIRRNLFKKEFRNTYLDDGISRNTMFGFSIFLGLVTFAIYFVLQTLTRSVLMDAIPQFMLSSYFSTLYLFVLVAYIFNVFYFIIYYEYLTFAEINRNRWYSLIKMSYNINSLIIAKIFIKIATVISIYTIGFLFTIFLTYFLKFPFVVNYMLALYFVGAINLIVLVLVTLVSSLFIKNQKNARYTVIIMSVITIIFQVVSGYYKIVSNRVLMDNIANLFDFSKSLYLIFAAFIIFTSVLICVLYGNKIAKYYTLPIYRDSIGLENFDKQGIKVVLQAENKFDMVYYEKKNIYNNRQRNKAVDILVSIVTIFVISVFILINCMVLAVTFVSPEKEIDILGTIPYVFQSETMQPTIMFNDLTFFSKISKTSPLKKSEIILFKDKGQVGVARILLINGNVLNVDIDNYTAGSQKGLFNEKIKRDEIYGVYYGRSRWLGAIILFANNIIGRILFLFIPAFLIFFYKPILSFVKKINGGLKD